MLFQSCPESEAKRVNFCLTVSFIKVRFGSAQVMTILREECQDGENIKARKLTATLHNFQFAY
jgi:hypothetical protein